MSFHDLHRNRLDASLVEAVALDVELSTAVRTSSYHSSSLRATEVNEVTRLSIQEGGIEIRDRLTQHGLVG
jgi:hypothetical protein